MMEQIFAAIGRHGPRWLGMCCLLGGLILSSGCTQRRGTPTLQYSDTDVQLIRDELDKADWS